MMHLMKPAGQLNLEAKQVSETHYEIEIPYYDTMEEKTKSKTIRKPLTRPYQFFYLTEGKGAHSERFSFRLSNTPYNTGEKICYETVVDQSWISTIKPLSK